MEKSINKYNTRFWAEEFETLEDAVTKLNIVMEGKDYANPTIKRISDNLYFAALRYAKLKE